MPDPQNPGPADQNRGATEDTTKLIDVDLYLTNGSIIPLKGFKTFNWKGQGESITSLEWEYEEAPNDGRNILSFIDPTRIVAIVTRIVPRTPDMATLRAQLKAELRKNFRYYPTRGEGEPT